MSNHASPGEWVGRLIDKRFPLFEWLGSAESGEVFRTELPGLVAQKVAIRIVPADSPDAQDQFNCWVQAEGLSHPHLLHIFETGHDAIDEREINFVVMELPEESLSDILPIRALSTTEVAELLPPLLNVLDYLHSRGLVHGHLNPDHILVIGDLLKLSSDNLQQVGHVRKLHAGLQIYDAPETAHGVLSPVSDVWSLGVTVVEALTQHPPTWSPSTGGDPDVPDSMPEPFGEIARRCLRVDPAERATLADLESILNSPAVVPDAPAEAPVEAEFVAPPEPEAPAPNLWEPASLKPAFVPVPFDEPKPGPRAMPPAGSGPRPKLSLPVIFGAIALLVVIIAAVVMRSHKAEPPQETPAASVPESTPPVQTPAPAQSKAPAPAAPEATPQTAPEPAPQAAPEAPSSEKASNTKGAVVERVMPEPPEKASLTISGKVTVKVRLQVDSTGAVSDASFDSEGPSQYFSKLAMQASRKWRFEPAAGPSVWVLRFDFRRSGTEVTPVEVKP